MGYNLFPRISTLFDAASEHPSNFLYSHSISIALRRIFFNEMFFQEDQPLQLERFYKSLPIVKSSEWGSAPVKNFSVFLLCRNRPNASKFFYDIISRWLLPSRRLNIGLFFSTDFKIIDIDEQTYTIAEIVLTLEDIQDLEMVRRNLPIIEPEIRLGVTSVYHASRIMEIKGLSADEKTSLIQERIAFLIQRRPKDLDYDIFGQMQHFLVMCREEFKAVREYHHMSRIISVFYLFRKVLRQQVETKPHKRHLSLKLINTRLHLPFGVKRVLALFVGLNFLKENEIFEQRHLIKALQHSIPDLKAVEDSCFTDENREDNIQTIYLEIEKESGLDFSLEEIKKLRKELPEGLKSRVERLMRPIFMPRNEEEVMRHIVTLSQQLRYMRDLPHVVISFDEQTDSDLFFTIVLVRVLSSKSLSIEELFQRTKVRLKFIPDRIKRVGLIRNKYPKEATVFRVRLQNIPFLREDHSLDLFKARQEVILQIQKVIGEVRDFNGGMIAKQLEVLKALRDHLGEVGQHNEFLLENFFHSIFPVELRSVVNPIFLKNLFLLLISSIQEEKFLKKMPYLYRKQEANAVYVIFPIKENATKKKIFESVEELNLLSSQLVCLHLQISEVMYLGYIYFTDLSRDQELFLNALNASFQFV